MSVLAFAALAGCDPASDVGVVGGYRDDAADAEAVADAPEGSHEQLSCVIGGSEKPLQIDWSDAGDGAFELSSRTGEFTAVLTNATPDPITADIQLVLRAGATRTVDLPSEEVPAGGQLAVPFDVFAAGLAREATVAPGQVMLRVTLNPGTARQRLAWSEPAYVHYAADRGEFVVYDPGTLRTRYGNGDLTGDLARAGHAPDTEIVLGAQITPGGGA